MKFYRIRHSLSDKQLGRIPQVKDVKISSSVDNPKFLGEIFFSEIDFDPIVPEIVLFDDSKLTDLIEKIMVVSLKLLVSEKLKSLIQLYRTEGVQFFRNRVFHNELEYNNYWFLHTYCFNEDYIDFNRSTIVLEKKADDYETSFMTSNVEVNIESIEDFEILKTSSQKKFETLYIKNLFFKDVDENFFAIRYVEGGIGYFVSEKLKNEIEEAGCTGIEFQPSELSYHEWVVSGGERERVYGRSW